MPTNHPQPDEYRRTVRDTTGEKRSGEIAPVIPVAVEAAKIGSVAFIGKLALNAADAVTGKVRGGSGSPPPRGESNKPR